MKPLENGKDLIGVFFLEADSVVLDGEFAQFIDRLGFAAAAKIPLKNLRVDFDHRLGIGWLKFQSVADEILQKLPHLERVGLDSRKGADFDFGFGLFDSDFRIGENFLRDERQVDRHKRLGGADNARESQQVVNERLHARGGVLHSLQVIAALLQLDGVAVALE